MSTHLQIDDRLIVEARKLGGHKSKKEAVTQALCEYIRRYKQQKVLGLFGKMDWDVHYNYKAGRKRP